MLNKPMVQQLIQSDSEHSFPHEKRRNQWINVLLEELVLRIRRSLCTLPNTNKSNEICFILEYLRT